jgi:transcriptional regulator with GAF, ATPase, and Fis domain
VQSIARLGRAAGSVLVVDDDPAVGKVLGALLGQAGISGTGKELAAPAIHELSPRRQKPFIKFQCAALPETETLRAEVRFVAATHRDLEAMAPHREFREDLFYRLNLIPIWLPPPKLR